MQLADGGLALEHGDPALGEHAAQLVALAGVPVMVAQHGEDRHLKRPARPGQDGGLLGLAVGGQVTSQQEQVGGPGEAGEGGLGPVAVLGRAVHVAGRGNPQRALGEDFGGGLGRHPRFVTHPRGARTRHGGCAGHPVRARSARVPPPSWPRASRPSRRSRRR
ncbi:MAG: hypothetical protein WKF33_09725 [Thermoleophilaceae bacterium]